MEQCPTYRSYVQYYLAVYKKKMRETAHIVNTYVISNPAEQTLKKGSPALSPPRIPFLKRVNDRPEAESVQT